MSSEEFGTAGLDSVQPAETGKEEWKCRAVVTGQAAECAMSSVAPGATGRGSSDVGLEGEMLI